MNIIQKNLQIIREKINNTAIKYNQHNKKITLLVVTKNQNILKIANMIELEQMNFGENYIQEGIEKIQYFQKTIKNNKLIWHYIGPIQSNKTRYIAEYFDWCHTIDRYNVAERLNKQRPKMLNPLNVLIQININYEINKSGIHPNQLLELSQIIQQYPYLKLRGIMCIPKYEIVFNKQIKTFQLMHKLFRELKNINPNIDTLSMGMSNDMKAAIISGSTLVRIGRAIFQQSHTIK